MPNMTCETHGVENCSACRDGGNKPPCATCVDICDAAKEFYCMFKMFKGAPGATMGEVHLRCPKNGLLYVADFRQEEKR